MDPPKPKDVCPIYGWQFPEVKDQGNVCPGIYFPHGPYTREELITEDDDYAYCL